MPQLDLSLIIPAYNEAYRLGRTLPILKAYFDEFRGNYEVVIVDDGSSDDTRGVIERFQQANPDFQLRLNHKRGNMGKGFSVKEGFGYTQYDWILFCDADLSIPLREIDHFKPYTDTHDVIVGSKYLPGSKVTEQPVYRKAMGSLFSVFTFLITNLRIKDTQCGFKMFSREAGEVIFPRQTIHGFGFDVELLYVSKKFGFRIKELPVEVLNDPDSRVSNLGDSFGMLRDLLKVRLNDWWRKSY